jgi:hypothetical protein
LLCEISNFTIPEGKRFADCSEWDTRALKLKSSERPGEEQETRDSINEKINTTN